MPTPKEKAFLVASHRISICKRAGGKKLNLSRLPQLDRLPPSIRELTNLIELDVSETAVADLSVLAQIPDLAILNLENSQVSAIGPLKSLRHLRVLKLFSTKVADLSPLSGMPSLSVLDIWKTPVTDVSVLPTLNNLSYLDMDQVKVAGGLDLNLVAGLSKLETLYLSGTDISDLSAIRPLTKLRTLFFSGTSVRDLSPLADLELLLSLGFNHTLVQSLRPIAHLTNIGSLSLQGTRVSDLAPIARFLNLTSLNIEGTPVADLKPISRLSKLVEGAKQNPRLGGINFEGCPGIDDPHLQELAFMENPERTERVFEYLTGSPLLESEPELNAAVVEEQRSTSVTFAVDPETGKIGVDETFGVDEVKNDQLHQQLHDGLLELVEALLSRCEPGQPASNQLSALRDQLMRFSDALGESPGQLKPALAVLRGNTLRIALDLDGMRRAVLDPDDAPIPEAAAYDLRAVVEAWNVYVGTDSFLDGIDSQRIGPDALSEVPSLASTAIAIGDAEERGIATDDAIGVLRDAQQQHPGSARATERAVAFGLEGMRNFAREALRLMLVATQTAARNAASGAAGGFNSTVKPLVQKAGEEFAKEIGKSAAKAVSWGSLIAWVMGNYGWLTSLFSSNPTMRQLLELLSSRF